MSRKNDSRNNSRNVSRESIMYGGTISDIEDSEDESRKKHKKRSERASEKGNSPDSKKTDKLRKKLSTLVNKYDTTKENLQSQIDILTQERNDLYDKLEATRKFYEKENQRLKKDFENKLFAHKENIDQSKASIIKKLEETISLLEKRVADYQQNHTENKKIIDHNFRMKERELQNEIEQLCLQNDNLRNELERKDREIQNIQKRGENTLQERILSSKQSFETQIKKINSEKDAEIFNLNSRISDLEHKLNSEKFAREQEIRRINTDKDNERTLSDKKLMDYMAFHNNTISEIRKQYEQEYEKKALRNQKETEAEIKKVKKELTDYKQIVENEKEKLKSIYSHHFEESNKIISSLKEEKENLENRLETIIAEKELEKEKSVRNCVSMLEKENKVSYDSKCKELQDFKLKYEKTVGELEETNHKLRERAQMFELNLKKLQENSSSLNNQFAATLAKQKENFENEISIRDRKLENASLQMQSLAEDSVHRINVAEQNLRQVTERYEDIKNKFDGCQAQIVGLSELLSTYQNEVTRKGDTVQQLIEQNGKLVEDLKTAERLATSSLEDKKKAEIELNKHRNKTITLTQTLNKYKNENIRMEDEIQRLKDEVSLNKEFLTKNTISLHGEQEKNLQLQKTIQNLENKLKISENSSEKRQNEIMSLRNSIQILESNASLIKSENEQARLRLIADTKKSEEIKINEKNNEIHSLKKELASEMEKNYIYAQKNIGLEREIGTGKLERDKLSSEVQRLSEELKNFNNVTYENNRLKNEIVRLQQDFKTTMNGITAKYNKEHSDLEEAKLKIMHYENQAAQLSELQTLLSKMRNDYEYNMEKKEKEYKEELRKLNDKLEYSENTLLKVENHMEKIKLDYMKKLTEAKALPPDDKKKLDDLIRDRDRLQSQLESSEKKLEQIQYEFLSATSSIKVRNEQLNAKEAELRRREIEIVNAPPKILDPDIRKSRDAALESLRKIKTESALIKEENIKFSQKLHVAESMVSELNDKLRMVQEGHNELKKSLVDNLNQQQVNHEKELEKRDSRISELEKMLMEKMKSS